MRLCRRWSVRVRTKTRLSCVCIDPSGRTMCVCVREGDTHTQDMNSPTICKRLMNTCFYGTHIVSLLLAIFSFPPIYNYLFPNSNPICVYARTHTHTNGSGTGSEFAAAMSRNTPDRPHTKQTGPESRRNRTVAAVVVGNHLLRERVLFERVTCDTCRVRVVCVEFRSFCCVYVCQSTKRAQITRLIVRGVRTHAHVNTGSVDCARAWSIAILCKQAKSTRSSVLCVRAHT